jgi:hypothetical protein
LYRIEESEKMADCERKYGRALLPILNRIAQLRTCLKSFQSKAAHD